MFRISFLVRDKHLPQVLRSLENKAMNLETQPVKEDKDEKSYSPKPKAKAGGNVLEKNKVNQAAIRQLYSDHITNFTIAEFCSASGCAKGSAYTFLEPLVEAGYLEKHKIEGKRANSYTFVKDPEGFING